MWSIQITGQMNAMYQWEDPFLDPQSTGRMTKERKGTGSE